MRVAGVIVLALACSAGFAAEVKWAGNPVISLDATGLPVGELTSWANQVGDGGRFVKATSAFSSPEVRAVIPGADGTAKQVVHFDSMTMLAWDHTAPAGITAGSDWSMEAWVAREAAANGENVYFGWGSRDFDVAQFCNNDGTSWVGWGGVPDSGWGGPRPPDEEFCHLAFTYDGTDMRFYVNSGLRLTATGPNNIPTGDPVTVGGIFLNWVAPLDGSLWAAYIGSVAKIRVHDGALTADDVRNNYLAERDGYRQQDFPLLKILAPPVNSIEFGKQPFDAGPTAQVAVTIKNLGVVPLHFTGGKVAIEGPDAADFGTDAADFSEMPPGTERSFQVWADPLSDNDPKHAALVISTDATSVTDAVDNVIPGTGEYRISLAVNYEAIYVDVAHGDDANSGSQTSPILSLQTALDRVGNPGTIVLAPGEYHVGRDTSWSQRFVTVKAPEGATIVQDHWAWLFQNGEADVSFENIAFTGGGGLSFFQAPASPFPVTWRFKNCTWNLTQWWHGLCAGENMAAKTTMVFEDCAFNISTALWGAIYCRSPFDVTLRRCTFNALGGIQCLFQASVTPSDPTWGNETPDSSLVMEGCTFNGGSAQCVAVGGKNTKVAVDRCWFTRDPASPTRYALELWNTGETLIANTVVEGTDTAFGIKAWTDPTAPKEITQIYNCTAVGTVDSLHTAGVELVNNPPVQVMNCIILGWGSPILGTVDEENNITDPTVTDPLFVAPNPFDLPATIGVSDYHLSPDSPAIDAGVELPGIAADFDGVARPQGAGFDIGAYEVPQEPVLPKPPASLAAVGAVQGVDLTWSAPSDGPAPTGYLVFRDGQQIAEVPASPTSYSDRDASLVPGTEYCYTVKSKNAAGTSDASNVACGTPLPSEAIFRRGDVNGDGKVDISDPINVLGYLFLGEAAPACFDAADADDTGNLDLTDGIYPLTWLYLGGPEPPDPGPRTCGPDLKKDTLAACEYTKC